MTNSKKLDFLEWRVARIVRETADAASIFIVNKSPTAVQYQAGQFLTLIFDKETRELRRSYSFSSSPGLDQEIAITVKRIPNGEISRYLMEDLSPGDALRSLPPAGRFTISPDQAQSRQIFFIAAGVGISPEFSLIKKILHTGIDCHIVLITQNTDEEHIIFKSALQDLEKQFAGKFSWISILSRPKENPGTGGHLTNSLLEKIVRARQTPHQEKLFFLCGPPPLMRIWHFTLRWMGFGEEQIRKETFNIEYIPSPPLLQDQSPKQVDLAFRGQHYQFKVNYPSSILDSALSHNIQLPYSCRAGRCSTCAAKCLSGKIKMSINEVLTDKDLEDGWILTCVGFAESDVQLSYPEA